VVFGAPIAPGARLSECLKWGLGRSTSPGGARPAALGGSSVERETRVREELLLDDRRGSQSHEGVPDPDARAAFELGDFAEPEGCMNDSELNAS
jgi:hypothetical protein